MINRIKQFISRRAVHDVSLVYVGALLNGISLFLINLFLGRALTKDLFGVFSLSILVLSTVAEISDFGLNGALLRFAPYYLQSGQTDKLKQLLKTIYNWRVWLSSILTILGIIFSPLIARFIFNRPEITDYLRFSFLGIGGVVLLGFVSAFLQSSQKFLYNSVLQSLKGLIRLILIVGLYFFGIRQLIYYLFVYLVIPWLLFLISYKTLPNKFKEVKVEEEVRQKMNSQLANFSFWLAIWSISSIIASRVDQAILSHLLGLEKVAVYAMAFQFVYLYTLAMQSIGAVLTPKISGLNSNQEVFQFIKNVFRWILPLALIGSLLIYPSQYIIRFIFGLKYLESLPIYLILSYSMVISLLTIPFSLVITVFNRTKLVALSGFIQILINFFINLLLIPKFGVIGAAYTFTAGIIFSLCFNLACSVYLLKFKTFNIVK